MCSIYNLMQICFVFLILCHFNFYLPNRLIMCPRSAFTGGYFLPCSINAGAQWVWVSGQAGLWGRGWGQGPLDLWQHRRWQVPHAQSHPVWWRESVLHVQVSQLLYRGSVGRVRAPAWPHRPGHRGPFGCCVQSKPADATSVEGSLMQLLVDFFLKCCNPGICYQLKFCYSLNYLWIFLCSHFVWTISNVQV